MLACDEFCRNCRRAIEADAESGAIAIFRNQLDLAGGLDVLSAPQIVDAQSALAREAPVGPGRHTDPSRPADVSLSLQVSVNKADRSGSVWNSPILGLDEVDIVDRAVDRPGPRTSRLSVLLVE